VKDASFRVVRVVTRLNVGGPTRQVASLMARLDAARYPQVLVSGVATPREGPGVIEVPGERMEIPDLVRPVSPSADRRAFRALVALFERIRPSIVHTHQAKAGWVGRMAAARAGVPVVVHTYHGHTFRGYFPWPQSTLFLALERMAARRSTALIAQADAQAADVRAYLGADARSRVRVIAPGVELDDAAPRRAAVPRGRVRILFPSRLERVKDPMLALDVVRLLPEGYELHVFGDGSLRDVVARAVAGDARLAHRVTLHAMSGDRAAVFGAGEVTLLTSREEGTPLSLIESQAYGVPVVAADVGAVRSVVADGGGRVVARRADALAAAVVEAASAGVTDPARAWVTSRFAASRMARDVAALYDELLARVSGA
jgi:glycosyltransferase involved in cell wall biosynthesis